MEYEREYQWYLIGTNRFGHETLPYPEFVAKWQEFEEHAEQLRMAEADVKLTDLDAAKRAEMQAAMKSDPFIRAVLVGMSTDPNATQGE